MSPRRLLERAGLRAVDGIVTGAGAGAVAGGDAAEEALTAAIDEAERLFAAAVEAAAS